MATLRDIRRRIVGVRQTQKITKAMKMVAAAKLRRAQSGVLAARPYAAALQRLLGQLAAGPDLARHPLVASREPQRVGVIVVTSDRGLCGAFNANLLRAALRHIAGQYPAQHARGDCRIFGIGRKGIDALAKRGLPMAARHAGVFGALTFPRAQAIARDIVERYLRGEVDRVDVIYNEFKSVARQQIVTAQFLPIPASPGADVQGTDYITEPSRDGIINELLPRHLNFQIWRILLESNAAEQGSRMTAMDMATENANELVSALQLHYNKARQASITKELLEVVSGADALSAAS
jgi:F-type H+-transporting ATPase subunit gamma